MASICLGLNVLKHNADVTQNSISETTHATTDSFSVIMCNRYVPMIYRFMCGSTLWHFPRKWIRMHRLAWQLSMMDLTWWAVCSGTIFYLFASEKIHHIYSAFSISRGIFITKTPGKKRRLAARPQGRGIGCLLCVHSLAKVLDVFLSYWFHYHVIFDHSESSLYFMLVERLLLYLESVLAWVNR